MKKGVDYIGICVCFFCHDGEGNYLFHKRSENCRDERGRWDCGGGSVDVGEMVDSAFKREVNEEYGVLPISYEFLGHEEIFREVDGHKTHWLAFRYRALVDRSAVINNEPEKHSELGWYKIDDLPKPLHSAIPDEVQRFRDKLT